MIMMGASNLRTFKGWRSRESRDLLDRLVAESRSFESAAGNAEKELLGWWFTRHAHGVLPQLSTTIRRRSPKNSLTLRCSPSTASKRELAAQRHKKARPRRA